MLKILHQIFRTGIVTEPLPPGVEDEIKVVGQELELQAMNNPIYNFERFGIHFTASPRFADMLLVTGPATRNMEIALKRTYNAMPPSAVSERSSG